MTAKHRPYVFLTSNRTREIHDALKRRCLYHWIEYPTFDKEYEIITTKFPEVETRMAQQICAFMQKVREMNFYKRPGVAETLDWASALIALNRKQLDDKSVIETMGCVFKYREDLQPPARAGGRPPVQSRRAAAHFAGASQLEIDGNHSRNSRGGGQQSRLGARQRHLAEPDGVWPRLETSRRQGQLKPGARCLPFGGFGRYRRARRFSCAVDAPI